MREDGGIIVDGRQVASTHQCCHCGMHFTMVKGSGVRRGWCFKCGAVTCGQATCDHCIPLEARLDNAEGKKTSHDDLIKQLKSEGAILI